MKVFYTTVTLPKVVVIALFDRLYVPFQDIITCLCIVNVRDLK